MSRHLSFSIALAAWIFAMPGVQAHLDVGQIITDLKKDAVSGNCLQVKVLSSDARYFMVTATPNQSAADEQLLQFAGHLADRVFADKDAELLVVFFDALGNDKGVRSVSLSRSSWESMKSNPSALAFTPVEEASGDMTPAVAETQPLDKERTELAGRIDVLKQKGVGVEPYLKAMDDSEADLKQGNEQAAREKLNSLSDNLKTQEKLLASRSTVQLQSGVSQSVAMEQLAQLFMAAQAAHPPANAAHPAVAGQKPAPAAPADGKQPDGYTLMKKFLGMSSINDLGGAEGTAPDRMYLIIAAKSLGPDCPYIDGPFLWERVRIALRIEELEHQKAESASWRTYNRDKIEALVKEHKPSNLHQLADNIHYLEHEIGVKELDRPKYK